jgi:hypothetical protein
VSSEVFARATQRSATTRSIAAMSAKELAVKNRTPETIVTLTGKSLK